MRSIVKAILLAPLAAIILAMVIAFFFGAPAALISETIDLLRMRSTASATVTKVEIIFGRKGSRPQVSYQYVVNDVQYESHRFAPGWFANTVDWTGGGHGLKSQFTGGQTVMIHYADANPSHACLEYGWFKWSIGFTLGVWGMVLGRSLGSDSRNWRAAGQAMVVSGVGLIILGPDIVPVAQLHWYALGFAAVFGVSALYLRFQPQKSAYSAVSVR